MNCRAALERLDDHVDHNLGRCDRWRLRFHLWICRNCRRYLATYRSTIRLAKLLSKGDRPGADERLLRT